MRPSSKNIAKAAAALLLLGSAAQAQPARSLTLYTEDLPPYNLIEHGKVSGVSSDLLEAAMTRLQIRYELKLVAWKRAFHEALTNPGACVYSTVRSPEREKLFQWVGPIAHDSLGTFVLPDSPIQAHSLAELKGLRTVITPGDYAEPKLRANEIVIVPTPAEKQLSMMLAGRIDFWVANRGQAQSEAKQAGIAPLRELFAYEDFDFYLACNRSAPQDLIERLNAEVKRMWDDGEAARITAKYM